MYQFSKTLLVLCFFATLFVSPAKAQHVPITVFNPLDGTEGVIDLARNAFQGNQMAQICVEQGVVWDVNDIRSIIVYQAVPKYLTIDNISWYCITNYNMAPVYAGAGEQICQLGTELLPVYRGSMWWKKFAGWTCEEMIGN